MHLYSTLLVLSGEGEKEVVRFTFSRPPPPEEEEEGRKEGGFLILRCPSSSFCRSKALACPVLTGTERKWDFSLEWEWR